MHLLPVRNGDRARRGELSAVPVGEVLVKEVDSSARLRNGENLRGIVHGGIALRHEGEALRFAVLILRADVSRLPLELGLASDKRRAGDKAQKLGIGPYGLLLCRDGRRLCRGCPLDLDGGFVKEDRLIAQVRAAAEPYDLVILRRDIGEGVRVASRAGQRVRRRITVVVNVAFADLRIDREGIVVRVCRRRHIESIADLRARLRDSYKVRHGIIGGVILRLLCRAVCIGFRAGVAAEPLDPLYRSVFGEGRGEFHILELLKGTLVGRLFRVDLHITLLCAEPYVLIVAVGDEFVVTVFLTDKFKPCRTDDVRALKVHDPASADLFP